MACKLQWYVGHFEAVYTYANLLSRRGKDVLQSFIEVSFARKHNQHGIEEKNVPKFYALIHSLGLSTRRCLDPIDYVYGVLGIFRIKIPRMTDPHAVWQSFLSELDNYMKDIKDKRFANGSRITGISDRAHQIRLLEAKSMADVYRDLLDICDEHVNT